MAEIINLIEETTFKKDEKDYSSFEGYQITTSDQVIKIGIADFQSCCENWGYFITNDDMSEFIGAELLSVEIVDECLKKDKAPDVYQGDVMYVNFETSEGLLQFTAYNEHNGYYGHEAVIISKQLKESEYL